MSDFTELTDLVRGGAAIACNDEFFAAKENLVREEPAEWREHEYTDRGKWMDGWETRRYRPADGVAPGRDSDIHDWCIVRLGLPGIVRGVVVDTTFFRGNYPDTCALWGAEIASPLDLAAQPVWFPLIPRAPLEGNAKNHFEIREQRRVTHVRLDIFPDGGVARLRVHGDVAPDLARLRRIGTIDLAAMEHGGVVETCSDMFFGSRANLIKPGPSRSMADGWETRRRRGPGHEWAVVRLAGAGTVDELEIDTSHFKGNAPALCTVEGGDGKTWHPMLASPLQAHTRHRFATEVRRVGPVTHLRLSTYPCGGVARFRAYGTLAPALPAIDEAALLRCCGSARWAHEMAAAHLGDEAELYRAADRIWWALPDADRREAFSAHPRIGASKAERWAAGEQARVADASDEAKTELAVLNEQYAERFGFIFLICATGRTAESMLADLRARLRNDVATELRIAAEEQLQITRLRLGKLLAETR
ncbi:MAG TPA: allantoicase [Kofleriaceae bacterium]|jgi:allantoicase